MSKILVVDDEKHIRLLLSELLKKYKYEVRAAADGTEAITLLEDEPFDLIVTDLHMANKGGIDVLKQVKEKHALSGGADFNRQRYHLFCRRGHAARCIRVPDQANRP